VVNPHDALFRAAFSDPRHAEGLLRSALPPAIAALIDWPTLRLCPADFVDPGLREHRADLLFSVLMLGREILLYVVVEHRSSDQRFLSFDMLRYVVRILERHRAEHPKARHLPMVIPLVVHHGEKPMRAHRRLIRLVELPREPRVLRRWLASHQPELRLVVDDLARVDEAELRTRALSATGLLNLFCLQFVRGKSDEEAIAAFTRIAHLAADVIHAENGQDAFLRLLSWLHEAADFDPERLRPIVAAAAGPAAEELVMNAAERLRREGRAQGLVQGQAQGQAQGRIEERHALVSRLLTRRFGPLAPAHEETLRNADPDQLERWALRLLDARSIDEVFAGN